MVVLGGSVVPYERGTSVVLVITWNDARGLRLKGKLKAIIHGIVKLISASYQME